jgi:hypothetical protein
MLIVDKLHRSLAKPYFLESAMNDQYFTTKRARPDGSSDARLSSQQDGVRAAARTRWRRPELKVLAVEETKNHPGHLSDGTTP